MKLRYTPQTQLDLRLIKSYISNVLMNKTAANRIHKAKVRKAAKTRALKACKEI